MAIPPALRAYTSFLTSESKLAENQTVPAKRTGSGTLKPTSPSTTPSAIAAAIFDSADPASPLHFAAKETALLLLDFQGFIISQCTDAGTAALAKAKQMCDWALERGITVVHSVVDVNAEPVLTCKGAESIKAMLPGINSDREAVEEPTDIAFAQRSGEYIVLKPPGVISGLKSHGATELLAEHKVKSLIICGLSSSGAVLRTAVPATDDGFVVSVISDACADRKDGVHDVVLKTLLPNRAHIANADEFVGEWQQLREVANGKEIAEE